MAIQLCPGAAINLDSELQGPLFELADTGVTGLIGHDQQPELPGRGGQRGLNRVGQRGDVHQPADVVALEFDKESERGDARYLTVELIANVLLHEVGLEAVVHVALRFLGAPRAMRALFTQAGHAVFADRIVAEVKCA